MVNDQGGVYKMKTGQTEVEDWRDELVPSLYPKLKFQDGETKEITFLDEGRKYKHPDFKPCVIFTVEYKGEKHTWFVNAEAYGLLNQIKDLGQLKGKKVKVTRHGTKKSDTRYDVVEI